MLAILVFGLQLLALVNISVQAASLPAQHPIQRINPASLDLQEIPGNTKLKYCKDSRPGDLLSIERLDIYPQQRSDDSVLVINIYGTFANNIDSDAIVKYRYEYKGDPEIEASRLPFCEFIDRIDQPILYPGGKCTAEAGWAHLSQEISRFENWFMGGDWVFEFDAVNGDGMRIFCVEGEIPALTEMPPRMPPSWQHNDEDVWLE